MVTENYQKIYDRNKYILLWMCEKILDVAVRSGVFYIVDSVIVKRVIIPVIGE